MLKLMQVGLLTLFIASVVADDTPNCMLMNEVVDNLLNSTNVQIEESNDSYQEYAYYVQQDVDLLLLNFKLPFVASLFLTNGRMGRLDTLYRHGDVLNCSSSDLRSLQGVYKYKELALSYDMNVTVLHRHVTGKLTYRVHPYIVIGVVKGTGVGIPDCNLEVYEVVKLEPSEYDITMEDSWMGWLVGKLLRYSLQGVENESMLGTILQTSTVNVNAYLGQNVCDTLWNYNS